MLDWLSEGKSVKQELIYILKQAGEERMKADQVCSECLPQNLCRKAVGSVFGISEYWGLSKRRQKDLEKEYPGILIKKTFSRPTTKK